MKSTGSLPLRHIEKQAQEQAVCGVLLLLLMRMTMTMTMRMRMLMLMPKMTTVLR